MLTREHGSTTGWLFFVFSLSVGVYFFGAGVSYATSNESLALVWERIAHTGVVTIPAFLFILVLVITGRYHKWRVTVAATVAITAGFLASVISGDWFIAGNTEYFWGFYPVYGWTGIVFLGWFALNVGGSLALLLVELGRAQTALHRRRIRGLTLACTIGYVGSVDFLPAIGVELYAFGYVPVFAFSVTLGAVILRFRLVDITPATAASHILATMPSGVLVADSMGTIQIANEAATELFSGHRDGLIGLQIASLLPDIAESGAGPAQWRPVYGEEATDVEVIASTGERRTVSVTGSMLLDGRGREIGYLYMARDVTELRHATAELKRLALYDPLTGLPNRVLFFDRVEHALASTGRERGTLALFYVDLNGFKAVNDRYGHPAGDTVLRIAAERMQASIRASDTLARIGGDEFVQVSTGVRDSEDAARIADKLVRGLDGPIDLGQASVTVGASVGIALFPEHGSTIQELLNAADSAMYRAKRGSGQGPEMFREDGPA